MRVSGGARSLQCSWYKSGVISGSGVMPSLSVCRLMTEIRRPSLASTGALMHFVRNIPLVCAHSSLLYNSTMMLQSISGGVVHALPADLKTMLKTKKPVRTIWEGLTPLARNEWICWVESAKMVDTRSRRLARVESDLLHGKRRPCCWAGCIHRAKTGKA